MNWECNASPQPHFGGAIINTLNLMDEFWADIDECPRFNGEQITEGHNPSDDPEAGSTAIELYNNSPLAPRADEFDPFAEDVDNGPDSEGRCGHCGRMTTHRAQVSIEGDEVWYCGPECLQEQI